jgi:hypothetical protein
LATETFAQSNAANAACMAGADWNYGGDAGPSIH